MVEHRARRRVRRLPRRLRGRLAALRRRGPLPGGDTATGRDSGVVQRRPSSTRGQGSPHRAGPHVDTVITSDYLGVAKPDPAIFAQARLHLGVPASAMAYVGDRLEVDAHSSSSAGLRGIWLDRTGAQQAVTGVETIGSLAELPALLARVGVSAPQVSTRPVRAGARP
ncbi:MAG: HAD-IA family hydrolase [Pseudonocardiaceae bacterium]|nr:HAD-IA family hydrolase [Pseudonocardiaceae bacterium]